MQGAGWPVHMYDLDVPWDEDEGYALPGMRAPGFRPTRVSGGRWQG